MKNKNIRAGRLLTRYLRRIAEEETECVDDPRIGDKMATKAEALARGMFKAALGYKEIDVKTKVEHVHAPDRQMMALIFDRLEGRSLPMAQDDDGTHLTMGERVTEQGINRINKLGGVNLGATENGIKEPIDKAIPPKSVPEE